MSRTSFGDRYFRKVSLHVITPWTCVLFDHRLGVVESDGWRPCSRPKCTYRQGPRP